MITIRHVNVASKWHEYDVKYLKSCSWVCFLQLICNKINIKRDNICGLQVNAINRK